MQKNAFEMQKTSLHSMTFQFHTLALKQYFEFDGLKIQRKDTSFVSGTYLIPILV